MQKNQNSKNSFYILTFVPPPPPLPFILVFSPSPAPCDCYLPQCIYLAVTTALNSTILKNEKKKDSAFLDIPW